MPSWRSLADPARHVGSPCFFVLFPQSLLPAMSPNSESTSASSSSPDRKSPRRGSRRKRPRPPSTRPPSSLRAAKRSDDHKAYVELANLQMARTRQTRIRAALQDQVERSTRRIQKIDEKVAAVKAEIQQSQSGQEARDDDGFAYQY